VLVESQVEALDRKRGHSESSSTLVELGVLLSIFCTEFRSKEVGVLLALGLGRVTRVSGGKGLIWLRSSSGRLWSELVDIHVWSLEFYIFLLVGRTLRDSGTVMGWVEGLHSEGGIWEWNP